MTRFAALACLLLLTLTTACGSVAFMRKGTPGERIQAPPAGKVLVNFHRPSGWGGGADLPVFDRKELIGNTKGGTSFQYVCDPGRHVFVARRDRVSVIDANLTSGKIYDIAVDISMGVWTANVYLTPLGRDDERRGRIPEWEADEKLFVFTNDAKAQKYQAKMGPDIEEIMRDFLEGDKQDRKQTLAPGDSR